MVAYWEPGTQYNDGAVVEYQGSFYKIIEAHRSQGDWTPDITPALWGKLQGRPSYDNSGDNCQPSYQPSYQQPPQQPQQQPYQQQPPQGQYPGDQKVDTTPHEAHWYDMDDQRKHQLEVGGALAAGAALLGGGFAFYKHHQKSEEQKKAQTWALSNWLNDAQARTNAYFQNPTPAPTWILNKGKRIPNNAILVGREKSWNLYICRAYYEGGKQIGKASDVFQKGAVIGYKHEEIQLDTYEILVGDMNGLVWIPARGRLNVNALGHRPVEGGHEDDGTLLYIAEAPHQGAVHPGKCSEKLDGAYIPYGGHEECITEYRVLCYKNQFDNY